GSGLFHAPFDPVNALPLQGTANNQRIGDSYQVQSFSFNFGLWITASTNVVAAPVRVIFGLYKKSSVDAMFYVSSTNNAISTSFTALTGSSVNQMLFNPIYPLSPFIIIKD
ncbi:MAG: hypothetical protein H7836_17500, partial [Magnetococcus sp. YQC-3]